MRRGPLLTLALSFVACTNTDPPDQLDTTFVALTADGVEARFNLFAQGRLTKPEAGTVVYSVYEGLPIGGEPICEARGPLAKKDYDVPKGVEYSIAARVTWTKPCPPSGAKKQYGMISFVTPDGKTTRAKVGMMPSSGQFDFPELDAKKTTTDAASPTGDALVTKLRSLGAVTLPADAALGKPCPTRTKTKDVLRIDRRLVPPPSTPFLDPPVELAFRAVNEESAQKLIRALQAAKPVPTEPADVDFVELVKVDTFEPPKITTQATASAKGTFAPGTFAGEVWVVDANARIVLCRASTSGTSTRDVQGKSYEVGANLERAFFDEVGAAINKSAREIAPWLPNTWP